MNPHFIVTCCVLALASPGQAPAENKPPETAVAGAYGAPVAYEGHAVSYPAFIVRFRGVDRLAPDAFGATRKQYRFAVQPRGGGAQGKGDLVINSPRMHAGNAVGFVCDGHVYRAEMFYTTAGLSAAARNSPPARALPEDEIVIWDEASARAGNPRLLASWEPFSPPRRFALDGTYAAGVRLDPLSPDAPVELEDPPSPHLKDLEATPIPLARTPAAYPDSLAGSGFLGVVSGWICLTGDGTVSKAYIVHSNDRRFDEPVQRALRQWRFTPPHRGGVPTDALLGYVITVPEDGLGSQSFILREPE